MPRVSIYVCDTTQQAATAAAILSNDGFRVTTAPAGTLSYDAETFVAADKYSEVRTGKVVVIGQKP